jgi:methylated-DNA-[protein]-cysteine S-methyltransferase
MATKPTTPNPSTAPVRWTVLDSPVGELRILAGDAAVTALEFDLSDIRSSTAGHLSARTSAAVAAQAAAERDVGERDDRHPLLREAVRQLRAYFARDLKEFDLPLAPSGTSFQQRVWEQLALIGYGETASYGQIARRLGMTNAASRAVGLANGRNPIPIVIPCHRVVGASGTLTGYAGGMERKRFLLDLEQEALFTPIG